MFFVPMLIEQAPDIFTPYGLLWTVIAALFAAIGIMWRHSVKQGERFIGVIERYNKTDKLFIQAIDKMEDNNNAFKQEMQKIGRLYTEELVGHEARENKRVELLTKIEQNTKKPICHFDKA